MTICSTLLGCEKDAFQPLPSLRVEFSQQRCFLREYNIFYTTTRAHSEVQREILQKHIPVNFSLFSECVCERDSSKIGLLTGTDWLSMLLFATPVWNTYSCLFPAQ